MQRKDYGRRFPMRPIVESVSGRPRITTWFDVTRAPMDSKAIVAALDDYIKRGKRGAA